MHVGEMITSNLGVGPNDLQKFLPTSIIVKSFFFFFLSWEVPKIVQYFLLYCRETDAFQAVNILKSELFLYYKLTDISHGTKVSDEILLRIKVFEICGPNS